MSAKREAEAAASRAVNEMVSDRKWPVKLTLKHPITFDDDRIASLEFRRPCMKDLKGFSPDESPSFDGLLLLASRMCGVEVQALELLSDEDGVEVNALALGFFLRSHPAGRRR